MKQCTLTIALTVLILTGINAQEFKLGAKAGVNITTIGGDQTDDVSSRTAFHVGLVAEIVYSDKFSFQPELLYSAQGYDNDFSKTVQTVTSSEKESVKLDYISLPLMAKYFVSKGFSIEAGPQVGYLIAATREFSENVSGNGFDASETGEEDIKDRTKSIDFGVGLGFDYQLSKGTQIGVRYNLGLSNIVDIEGSDLKRQNNVFQFFVGFMLN